jgi:general stress protein 26
VARQITGASRYCTLVTLGRKHEPQARIVDPTLPDASFEVYFATNPRSRKVDEIRKDPRVTLLYFDPSALAYVTVIGHALEVQGTLKADHYKREWQGFFSLDRPDSYTLYRIVPSRVEVVSPKDGLSGNPITWRPETVDFK